MELYMKGSYVASQKKVISYVESYPEDALAKDLMDMINKTISSIYIKKAFALLSENQDAPAAEELEKATSFHSDYTGLVEARFSSYMKEIDREEAANKMIFELLNRPEPSDKLVYDISRRVRERISSSISNMERHDLDKLIIRVDKYKAKKKWSAAVEIITDFLKDNPGNSEARLKLSEINRLAAQDFYIQAVRYYEMAKKKKSESLANQSSEYDREWFEKKVEAEIKEAKDYIADEKYVDAKKKLGMMKFFDPGNAMPSLYSELMDHVDVDFFDNTMRLYREGSYMEATARFDLMLVRGDTSEETLLYYHLSSSRMYIRELKLDRVKRHLIEALKISPNNREAVRIFDRLQDVLEINSITY
jgi:tetratricopeptide (TPR) repeat protein